MAIKLLHTSDWHLGRALYGRKRYDEFAAFLSWLGGLIRKETIDVLLVAGDIFDSAAPGVRAQELYYRFLWDTASAGRCHVIITAGNHDSPSFLDAPKDLLSAMNIHVIGSALDDPADEVLVINLNSADLLIPEAGRSLIVCAVPYLRDRDIRTVESGESVDDKSMRLIEGITNHYTKVVEAAEEKQKSCGDVPVIVMGHMFTAGGTTVEGDGVRELYVGSLAHIDAGLFPSSIDYLALGHLHSAQKVGGLEHMRYSGSPVPMGFGESGKPKSVVLVSFQKGDVHNPDLNLIEVPVFQHFERIKGNLSEILTRLSELKETERNIWLEIEFSGDSAPSNLRELLEEAVKDSALDILRVRNRSRLQNLMPLVEDELLEDLDEMEVFKRCLDASEIEDKNRLDLIQAYRETLDSVYESQAGVD